LTEIRKIKAQIKVTAKPKYESLHEVRGAKHVFSYTIKIENLSDEIVQLKRRHWFILDGDAGNREVEGEGVIGEQPILHPGQSFEYQSWCPIASDYGSMSGFYTFTAENDETFEVEIPNFVLMPDYLLN
jgi:ApaG protein